MSTANEDELNRVVEVDRVRHLKAGAKKHLSNAKNDGCFHLERVKVLDLLVGAIPHRVDADWVHTVLVFVTHRLGTIRQQRAIFLPATVTKDLCAHGCEVVVDDTTEERVNAHQCEDVLDCIELRRERVRVLFAGKQQPDGECEQNGTVVDVAEHDTKQEWEADDCEDSWIGFLVAWNSVSVHDLLEY